MLREISSTRQHPDEPRKRWFSSASMDLVTWFDGDDVLVAFHLCYDKPHAERAVVWGQQGARLEHLVVDDGEATPGKHKASPVMITGSYLPLQRVREKLLLEAAELPPVILADVLARLDTGEAVEGSDP
jgi:hypothetical protein